MKLKSSMTLFEAVSGEPVFNRVLDRFFELNTVSFFHPIKITSTPPSTKKSRILQYLILLHLHPLKYPIHHRLQHNTSQKIHRKHDHQSIHYRPADFIQ